MVISILVIVYKSIMKQQGPNYVNDRFVANKNSRSKRQFPLLRPHFTTRLFKAFVTKLIIFNIKNPIVSSYGQRKCLNRTGSWLQ